MDKAMKKKEWITPTVERIDLEFDKEMTLVCVASANMPAGATSCGAAGAPCHG